jgi:cell wall-associated NlpC family hydrolase
VTYRPPRCARRESSREVGTGSQRRLAPAFVIALAALLAAAGSAAADPSISSKQSEARQVLAQINRLDISLEHAIQAYDTANVKLAGIERDQKRARFELGVAKANLRGAQAALAERLVAIYTSDTQNSALEVLLGSRSLDDLLNRIEAVNRVSSQDAETMREVRTFKRDVVQRQAELRRAHAAQARVVRERAAAKASIQGQLARRRTLLSSIRSEIATLQAQERARQAQLAAQARARLPAQSSAAASAAAQNPLGVGASTPEGASVAPPSRYGGVVGIAMRYLGTPYVWGGASPSGFDCSGFTMYVYAQVGVSLPHSSYAQYGMGVAVSQSQLQPGDLVFFYGLGHVGIYIGGGQYIHAPHTGDVVKISTIGSGYVGARRIL